MFKVNFGDYGNTPMKYCYIHNSPYDLIPNESHIATLCMNFSPLDNKLLAVTIPEHRLEAYPELHKAILETLFPLLERVHKNDAENIINTFMLIYSEVK